jgi:Bacterial TniB protein
VTDAASLSVTERQKLIRNIVVEHPRYLDAFNGLARLHRPVKGGLHTVNTLGMLVGDSRAGKTFAAKRYAKSHPETAGETGLVMPVLYVEMPPEDVGSGVRGVLDNIADALKFPHTQRMTNQFKMAEIIKNLKARDVQLVILDEFEQVFRESDKRMASFGRSLLRKMLNLGTLSVVCIGLEDTYRLLRADKQLLGRGGLPYRHLPSYSWDNAEERVSFRQICDAFDRELPFEERSGLGRTDMAVRLHYASDGHVGRLQWMIEAAAGYAMDADALSVDRAHFAEAYDERMELGTDFNPFRHDMSLVPKKGDKSAYVKAGGTGQVYSKSRQRDVRDAA